MEAATQPPGRIIPECSARQQSEARQRQGRRHTDHPDGAESSADETTGIVTHKGSRLSYQTAPRPATAASVAESTTVAAATAVNNTRPGSLMDAGGPDPKTTERKSPIKNFLAQFQSIELENKGSVARDHLAIERTFLAWLRTSLAFASIGIGVTQLFRLNANSDSDSGSDPDAEQPSTGPPGGETLKHIGKPLGTTFLAISILVLLLGYRRYTESQRWVMDGKFPASRGTIILVAAVAFALMIASLIVVVAVQSSASER